MSQAVQVEDYSCRTDVPLKKSFNNQVFDSDLDSVIFIDLLYKT